MAHRITEQMIMFPFEFLSPTEITIEETSTGVAIISGTLLKEGRSKNGNLYTVEEMDSYANQAIGLPIYVGTMTKVDPNTGLRMKNKHANVEPNRVGKIIKTVFNKAKRAIKFWAELVNTVSYPNIISRVKKGWGISIGGIATKAKLMIEESGRIITKILGLVLNHIQLLPPKTPRGQQAAMVESVEVQESMIFYELIEQDVIENVECKQGIKKVDAYFS